MKIKPIILSMTAASMLYAANGGGDLTPPVKQDFTVSTVTEFNDAIDIAKHPISYDRTNPDDGTSQTYNLTLYTLKASGSSPTSKLQLHNPKGGSLLDRIEIEGFESIVLNNVDMKGYNITSYQSRHINGAMLGSTIMGSISVKNSILQDMNTSIAKVDIDSSNLNNVSIWNARELNISNSTVNPGLDSTSSNMINSSKATISNTTINGHSLLVYDLHTMGKVKLVDSNLLVLRNATGDGIDLEYTKTRSVDDGSLGSSILPNNVRDGYVRVKYTGGITAATPGVMKIKGDEYTEYYYSMDDGYSSARYNIVFFDYITKIGMKMGTILDLFEIDWHQYNTNHKIVPLNYEVLDNGDIKIPITHKHYKTLLDSGVIDSNGIIDFQKLENIAKYANEEIYGDSVERISFDKFFATGVQYEAAQIQKNQAAINLAHTALSQTRFAYTLEINNMSKRLGEIRGLEGEQGVWLRSYIGKGSYKDYEDISYYQVSVGADKYISDDTLLGFSFGYSKQNLSKDIKGTQDTYILTAYGSKFFNNGAYVDGVAKYLHSKGEYENNLLGNIIDNKLNSKPQNAFLLSLEAGYRFDIDKSLTLEPQAELITGYIPENTITSDRVVIKSNSYVPINIKAGVNTIYKPNNKLDLRVGLGGIADLNDGKVEYDVEDSFVKDTTTTGKDSRIYTNIFGSYKLNNKTRINLELEKTFGGDFNVDYNASFNIRYQF